MTPNTHPLSTRPADPPGRAGLLVALRRHGLPVPELVAAGRFGDWHATLTRDLGPAHPQHPAATLDEVMPPASPGRLETPRTSAHATPPTTPRRPGTDHTATAQHIPTQTGTHTDPTPTAHRAHGMAGLLAANRGSTSAGPDLVLVPQQTISGVTWAGDL
ncbi:hypothetical protein ACQP2P_16455 [Dactylosporangium sp. CA-139114]|uniref:hypothetical protein n=1 Tax=Dactylosporangium sp. CA-139114 TaxID=3239931 RepID=UPI003D99697F